EFRRVLFRSYAPCTPVPPGHEYIAFGIQFEVLAIGLRRSKRSWLIGRFPVTCHGSDLRLSGIGECFVVSGRFFSDNDLDYGIFARKAWHDRINPIRSEEH